jgi:hypothetical protein
MKIRTKEDLQNYISDDLAWRKKELSNLYNDVKTANPKRLPTSLRCAVVILYAHWEGFIKNAAQIYLIYIKSRRLTLVEVNNNLLALSLKQKINEFNATNKATCHVKFVDFFLNNLGERANFSETDSIRTGSNLSSTILEEILATIGIEFTPYELKSNLIDGQLLHYRNTIAHGNYLPMDKTEYETLHSEVIRMLDSISIDITNATVLEYFRL